MKLSLPITVLTVAVMTALAGCASSPNLMSAISGTTAPASGGLTDTLAQSLDVTPTQASGGAGAIFKIAQSNLDPDQFARIATAVPGMDSLLGAAPELGRSDTGVNPMAGAVDSSTLAGLAGMADMAGIADNLIGPFNQLGLDPQMIGQFVPVILNYVQSSGGAGTADLLKNALY